MRPMGETTGLSLISIAVAPKTAADRERLVHALRHLTAQDATVRVSTDTQTSGVIIAATGERHLETIVDRLKREFNVEASIGKPQVAYKETLTARAEGHGRFGRQAGGRGEFADAKIRLGPLPQGGGYQFSNAIVGGAIPTPYIEPINQGIQDALTRGVLAGYPIDDVRVELYDGSYHDADSSELAFKVAGAMAFVDAANKARPVLLEPVMRVEISIPQEYAGGILSDLTARRGEVQSREHRDGTEVVRARVPLAELFGYRRDLQSRTHGRGTYSEQFDRYEPVRGGPSGGDHPDDSVVGAPRKPAPKVDRAAASLPEPDEGLESH